MNWFTKSLLPQIAKDVAMSGEVTKDQDIHHAQHLDFIYSQVGMLYNIIPHAPRYSKETLRLTPRPHANGVVGSTSSIASTQFVGKLSQMTLSDNPTNASSVKASTATSTHCFEVNSV